MRARTDIPFWACSPVTRSAAPHELARMPPGATGRSVTTRSSARAADLVAGVAGETLGTAAALIGGVGLVWRRSRPGGVLVVCVAGYAVNAAVVPGVPPYAGWVALYAAGVYGRGARRAGYSVI